MSKAIRIYENGGPEVLKWEDFDPGEPEAGEALVRHEAVGLNFIDVYHRTGLYPLPALPGTPGMEGAGIVEEDDPEFEYTLNARNFALAERKGRDILVICNTCLLTMRKD